MLLPLKIDPALFYIMIYETLKNHQIWETLIIFGGMQLLLGYPDPFYFWVSLPITKQQQQYNLGTTTSRVDCWAGSTSEEEPTTQNYLCNLHSGHLHTKMIILPYLVIKSFFLQPFRWGGVWRWWICHFFLYTNKSSVTLIKIKTHWLILYTNTNVDYLVRLKKKNLRLPI